MDVLVSSIKVAKGQPSLPFIFFDVVILTLILKEQARGKSAKKRCQGFWGRVGVQCRNMGASGLLGEAEERFRFIMLVKRVIVIA